LSDLLVPGSLWRDRRPERRLSMPGECRRVVEVVDPGARFTAGSRVTGISWWQYPTDGAWVELRGRRYTSILRHQFLSKFEHIRGPE
jgi:hypothetical protein